MLRHVLGIPASHYFRVSIENTGIQRFRYKNETWQLVSWGEVDHLTVTR
jgi:hypothetical protein